MENINNFLQAAEQIGVKKLDLFQTVDLYEQVTLVIKEGVFVMRTIIAIIPNNRVYAVNT